MVELGKDNLYGGAAMKKVLSLFIAVFLMSVISMASVNILSPVGPTLVSLVGILEKKVDLPTEINVDYWKSFDQITASIVTGSSDIIILPVTTGAALFNKDIQIELAAVTLWKGFFMVGKDISIDEIADMKNPEVYTPQGKGQTGDVLVRNYLKKIGFESEKNVSIKYATAPEIVGLMSQGKVKLAAIPEPFVSLAIIKAKAEILVDFQKEWGELTGYERIPITGIFVRKDSLKEKPQQIEQALASLEESVKFCSENTELAVKLTTTYFNGMPEAVLMQSMQRSEYEYVPANLVEEEITEYLKEVQKIEFNAMPEIPGEEFFAK